MKKYQFLILILLFSASADAQQKMLSMDDAMLNARTTLAPDNFRRLDFIKNSNDYVYLKKTTEGDVWMKGSFKPASESVFLTLGQLNQMLLSAMSDTLTTMPALQFTSEQIIVTAKGRKIAFSRTDSSFKVLMDKQFTSKEKLDESSKGYLAYTEKDNLFVSVSGNIKQITTDGSTDIEYASAVHRNEFGINKGTFWSNNGEILAFYRMDQSMVTDYPVIDWTQNPAKNTLIKYPMAGGSSHHVTVGVYNVSADKTIWLKTGEPAEQYLTNIAWSPDDRTIYIAVVNRAQNHMWLNQYNATTGDFIKTLFEETDSKYVEPLVPMLFLKNNPQQFIWQSKKDGWNQLYLYNTDGKLQKQLTSGQWEVLDVKGFDAKEKNLFYVSTEASPISKNLYMLNMGNLKTTKLTEGDFVHNTSVSTTGEYILDNYSSTTIPRIIRITNTKNGKSREMLLAANPLSNYALGNLRLFTLKNNEGTDLYCRMFTPAQFDSTRKYPVIVYWYGGPHAQLILNSWNGGAGDYWFQYMAERGYVVFSMDTRGSASRGRAFEQSVFRQLGIAQMADMMVGVNYLHSLKFTDKERMGLFGWSFGGFLTTDFLLQHPGIFKAGVAGGPVMDWKYYEIMYGERYMDTPQENPEGYDKSNLIIQAGKLKDKLLLIHGLQDPVVVQQHSVNFVKAAVDKGVQVDYMIYPGHEHNVLGKDRAHLYQKVTDYFNLNLQ